MKSPGVTLTGSDRVGGVEIKLIASEPGSLGLSLYPDLLEVCLWASHMSCFLLYGIARKKNTFKALA